ncbi:MAG: hypothetical protein K6A69_02965 [Lachnospiraceae bacterium]|nr:hypothetical protein [Lachnospiraceae bacterium]
MSDLNEREIMDVTEDDLYLYAVQTRLNSMTEILKEIIPDIEPEEMMGINGLPFLRFHVDNDEINISYYMVGGPDDDKYILNLRSIVYMPEEPDAGLMVSCDGFNFGSPFGHAVYDPVEGYVELRAQVPEAGGISDTEQYEHMLNLFLYSIDELRTSIEEE